MVLCALGEIQVRVERHPNCVRIVQPFPIAVASLQYSQTTDFEWSPSCHILTGGH